MHPERLQLAPGFPGLGALGLSDTAPLYSAELGERAEALEVSSAQVLQRFALPGTPGPDGRLRGKPGGAGTGWVVVRTWRSPGLGELLRARLSAPRSASLAEREWNLICHLRAHGVGTPEPLVVGARGRALASRASFLVTRELRGFVPFEAAVAETFAAGAGTLVADLREACVVFLRRLLRSRVVGFPSLDVLRLRRVHEHPPEEDGGDGGHEEEGACASGAEASGVSRMERKRLPGLAFADVREGRLCTSFEPTAVASMLSGWAAELSALGANREELRALLRGALRGVSAYDRRALLRALRR